MKAEKISITEAKQDKLFYVVANTTIYRPEDSRCLILKRDEREKVHPGKWASVGGKLEHQDFDLGNPSRVDGEVIEFEDSIPKLLGGEALEEAGIQIAPNPEFIGTKTIIRTDGIPVFLIKFASQYLEGDVTPEAGAFTDYKWVNEQEVDEYDCIEGIAEEIKATISLFKSKSSWKASKIE